MTGTGPTQAAIERHWERARRYLAQGQLGPARATFESMRGVDPDDVRTHLLGAEIAWQSDKVRDTAEHARHAAHARADDPDLVCGVIDGLLQTGESLLARECLDRPLMAQTDSTALLLRMAGYRQRLGEHPASLELLERIRALGGDTPDSHYYRGQQLVFNGRLHEAADDLEQCLQTRPEHGRAAQILARLRQQTSEANHLPRLDEGLKRVARGGRDHAALEFACYKELEDLGRWEEAWDALARGNQVMSQRNRSDIAGFRVFLERFAARCASIPPNNAVGNRETPQPIFVIGLPRSGSTLLERMLGNHPDIAAAGELQDFDKQLQWLADTHNVFGPEFLGRLDGLDIGALGRRYLEQTRWRARGKAWFVDKQLVNWMLVGLIRAALPQARILHMLRAPMDVCFSNWRAYFGDTHAYSYDLPALAAYYQTYLRVMVIWRRAFPGAILDVPYSRLVGAPQETLRTVFEFCGVSHVPECADIARNPLPVATLSSADVHHGLREDTVVKWPPYARQLSGLRAALERMGLAIENAEP